MAKRYQLRRQGSRMDRLNKVTPKYTKGALIFVAAGVVVALGIIMLTAPEGTSPGRALLETKDCEGDLLLSKIDKHENNFNVAIRATIYLIFLGYLFLGVAISADTFMAAIEVITSKTTTVKINNEEIEVEVWNGTVANLTLMALGSSAPEILLAVVETCSMGFEAGELGPGTIVGSAAFNLLFITAICISALPELEDNPDVLESRMIEEFGVFGITAVASLWAYLWMVIVLSVITPNQVDLGEGIVTLFMFPLLVWVSWAEDQSWWGYCGSAQVTPEGETETRHGETHLKSITGEDGKKRRPSSSLPHSLDEDEQATLKADPEAEAKRLAQEAMKKKKKSRLEYRIQATRKMTGGKRVMPTAKDKAEAAPLEVVAEEAAPEEVKIDFADKNVSIPEGGGQVNVKVVRSGLPDESCTVQFDTSDGDAVADTDYITAAGTLEFAPGVTEQFIEVPIIDDDEWAPDKHFFVRLYNPQMSGKSQASGKNVSVGLATCQVTILNDDDPGTISFEAKTFHAMDTNPAVSIKLMRKDGNDGNVLAFLRTVDGTAKANEDFKPLSEDFEVHFENKQLEGEVTVELIKNAENQNCTFTVEITQVEPEGAKLGDHPICTVIVTNDKNYQKLMEDVVAMMDDEMGKYGVGTSSWSEQFHDAMNMGGDDDEEPEWSDYLMHFLSFYWKVLHAFVPPTDMAGGWYTFFVSLCFIGGITALVGDAAKILGCCMGLEDSITAITFVALGTSLPDTFASMEATVSDETADAAITNVTGSNSVNVFLGLGLPWTMATVYHAANSTVYEYQAGSLAVSVIIFFVFALACIGLLVFRRYYYDGELGGDKKFAYICSAILGLFWFLYVVMSALQTYHQVFMDTSTSAPTAAPTAAPVAT